METNSLIRCFKSVQQDPKMVSDQEAMGLMTLIRQNNKDLGDSGSTKNRRIGSLVDFKIYVHCCLEQYESLTLAYEKIGTNRLVSDTVNKRKIILERIKSDSEQKMLWYKKNEYLDKAIPLYQFQMYHMRILFIKKIYDVGTRCIVRYPYDRMIVNNLHGTSDCENNFVTLTCISGDFVTFSVGPNSIDLDPIHKSDIFIYNKRILSIVSDFYVRHLQREIHIVDYWILAIACMNTVIKNGIYNVEKYCTVENCTNEKVGHLINCIHSNTPKK